MSYSNGYGKCHLGGKPNNSEKAHRISWKLHRGEIAEGLNVCHKCDTPACVNPDHLFLGGQRDNLRDAARKGRTSRGSKRPLSKLTENDVIAIRMDNRIGIEIAKQYGVGPSCIYAIKSMKTWGWLK